MTQQELERIQQDMASKTPGKLMEEARKRNEIKERVRKLKQKRRWK